MVSDAAPQMLSTVLCSGQPAIHLAVAETPGEPAQAQRWTLCGQPVLDRVSAQSFHRLGCSVCAREAVGIGATSIADRRQAVNLPRFLAALDRTENPAPRSPQSVQSAQSTLPTQRDPQA